MAMDCRNSRHRYPAPQAPRSRERRMLWSGCDHHLEPPISKTVVAFHPAERGMQKPGESA
jgi:hypothetical protein